MVSSRALSVAQYLLEQSPERRSVLSAVRDVINQHLQPGFVESMNWGMICWEVPLERYPQTYNGHPLAYLALGAQKNNFALYTMAGYGEAPLAKWIREEFRRAGVKLDMGKSCIRFKTLDGLPMSVVRRVAGHASVEEFIATHEKGRHGRMKAATRPAKRKTARGR